jgi:hypothetical protein
MGRRRGDPVARSAEPRCRDASTLRTATTHRTGRNMRGAAARPADMGPADVRLANMRPADMRCPEPAAAACPEAYSAAVPTKPAAMSAKASEVSATTMPTATAAVSPAASAVSPAASMPAASAPATAGVCFECEKGRDDEQHRGNASASSHGAAGLAPHHRGRLSLGILPRTKSFQY